MRLAVNLYSESSLADDVQRAQKTLTALVPSKPLPSINASVLDVHHQPEKEGWCSLLRQALSEIANKRFDKVVLARRSTLTLNKPLNPAAFLNASQKVNHRCFHFMMRMDDEKAFLGSSPECLFLRKGQRLTTEALAGTVAGSPDDEKAKALGEWLMQDKKTSTKTCWSWTTSASACREERRR